MAGILSLAMAATLAVALVEHGMTGTCPDNMGTKGRLVYVFHGKARELSLCLKDYRRMHCKNVECGRTLKSKTCSQLKDHFVSFMSDLRLCLQGSPTTTTTTTKIPATATTAATTTTTATTATTTTTTTPLSSPRDCKDLQDRGGSGDRVTDIFPDGENSVSVRCINDATVFFNRDSPAGDYQKTYAEYESGFGARDGTYYLGNKAIHDLTSARTYKLVVNVVYLNGSTGYAVYDTFRVAGPDDWYRLTVGNYSGNTGDGMVSSANRTFSAKDKGIDGDAAFGATIIGGGFWWHPTIGFNLVRPTATPSLKNRQSIYAWNKVKIQSVRLSLERVTA